MNKIRNLKFFGLVCLLTFALVFIGFHLLQAQVGTKGKPDKPPGKEKKEKPKVPTLFPGDIITTESDALSVWRYPSYVPEWTKETKSYYYDDVAVGDVDSDPAKEIVVPVEKPYGRDFKIFIDVYNEGSGIPLSSENYCREDSCGYFIHPSRIICDITVADVIPEKEGEQIITEIVLLHWHNLVIFQWDGSNFRIIKRIPATDLSLRYFNGMTAKNFDLDNEEEIFVSGEDKDREAYIYRIDIDWEDNSVVYTPHSIGPPGGFTIAGNKIGLGHSLRVADLDGDDHLEICLPGSLENRLLDVSYWTAYLLVLEPDQTWCYTIIPGYEAEKNVSPSIRLDVGELDSITSNGEEIALCVNQQQHSDYHLYIFKYPFTDFVTPLCVHSLQEADSIYDIKIGNIYYGNEIVVCGSAPPLKGKSLRKYFEVFGFISPGLQSCCQVFGEKGSIGDLAIVVD